jgi:hypothetical protein
VAIQAFHGGNCGEFGLPSRTSLVPMLARNIIKIRPSERKCSLQVEGGRVGAQSNRLRFSAAHKNINSKKREGIERGMSLSLEEGAVVFTGAFTTRQAGGRLCFVGISHLHRLRQMTVDTDTSVTFVWVVALVLICILLAIEFQTKYKSGNWARHLNAVRSIFKSSSIVREVGCPTCGCEHQEFTTPTSLSEIVTGGWTCSNCGTRIDKWGHTRK